MSKASDLKIDLEVYILFGLCLLRQGLITFRSERLIVASLREMGAFEARFVGKGAVSYI